MSARCSLPVGPQWPRRGALAGLCALVAIVGCETWQPDLGPPSVNACLKADSDTSKSVSFKDDVLDGILKPACLPCHDPNGEQPLGYSNGGLDLTDHAGVMRGGAEGGSGTVVPGDPCASYLVDKLVGTGAAGMRMPEGAPPLSAAQIQVIHDWIAEGARDN